MPLLRRRAYEEGHRPKYLVVVDESPEFDRALYFAARRAARTGAAVLGLHILETTQVEGEAWLGVGELLRAEAEERGAQLLARAAERARAIAGIEIERRMHEGPQLEALARVIEEDADVAALVLGASTDADGPGPLVAALARQGGTAYAIPVTIVPGDLSDADIDALAG